MNVHLRDTEAQGVTELGRRLVSGDVFGRHQAGEDVFIDLGVAAPINQPDAKDAELDRRGVSWRWLFASALIGAFGVTLIGSAIFISFDGDTSFAEPPETAFVAGPSASGETAGRKGDKLVAQRSVASAKQVVRAPISQRIGEREVTRVRPFVRLAANLSLTTGVYATDIPPFNPLRLFAEGAPGTERFVDSPADAPDADVTVVKRELASLLISPGGQTLSDADVISQIEEERANAASVSGRRTPLPIPPQLMLGRTLRQAEAPALGALAYAPAIDTRFSNIEVRVVPENVTTLAKTPTPVTREPLVEEKTLVVKRGETMEQVLRAASATPEQARSIVAALKPKNRAGEGQVLQAMVAPGPLPGDGRQVVRVALLNEGRTESIAAVNDRGVFVPVTVQREEEESKKKGASDDDEDGENEPESGPRLYDSLYETGMRHEMPRPLIDEMVRVFASDVDFQRRVSGGDSLEVIYTDAEDGEGSRTEILSATLTIGGEARRVYRFHSPEDGLVDYFDDQGRSLKKFLIRKPITDGEMRSGFGMRYHPILRYSKMHTGIDWANRIGTPILAAGNGTIAMAEWSSGYGRRVEIQHANGYMTTYSHMSGFARGIQEGARVRQGQVIGYLGSSGLSTGPHLHYEVMVNGNFVNPMRIKVPRGRELDGRTLAEFKRQRDEIDGLIVKAGGVKLAQSAADR
jgi:murein DD-endopeptidase MepM/ murein hydrolase activator NlpD